MNKILHFIVQETFETFQYTCFKSYVGTNSSKAMYEENVRQFKTCVIATGNLEQMLISSQKLNNNWGRGRKLTNKNGDIQKYSTLYHTISTIISKLEKHT